uniref:Related to Fasciclin domain family protein n=1 Tax=Ramularia collo-cygni TaxID=112498 RepID=A0A2D3UQM7_9PEZI
MKFSTILPLAALSTAFVLPDEQVLRELKIEDHHHQEKASKWFDEVVATKDDVISEVESAIENLVDEVEASKIEVAEKFESTKDDVLSGVESTKDDLLSSFEQYFQRAKDTTEDVWSDVSKSTKNLKDNAQDIWVDVTKSSKDLMDEAFSRAESGLNKADSAVRETANDMQSWFHENVVDTLDDHHHHEPNQTVYQLIATSNYTRTLAKLVSDYPDLVEALNSTTANYTIFAPIDSAFEKIPKHHPKPSKEQLHAILSYHVLPDVYTAKDVLYTHTAPTLLKGKHLSSKPEPQRVAFKFTLRGLTVNFYSRIIAVNIMGTNGVIHGVDSIIIPPPKVLTLIDLFPSEFSTLELGLGKTGLLEKLNTTHHNGGTFFAPSNFAFQKLGARANAFLFSKYGEKYLKALLEYHVVPDNTLYSDAYYKADSGKKDDVSETAGGYFHVDLPTLLEDRNLSVDIARYGGFISIKINGFSSVSVQDGVAQDGVLHVVSSVLIPPKQVGGGKEDMFSGGEIDVEELKVRLQPFVPKSDL